MAWVKLTDDFTENRKILEAGPLASWLWVSAIAWSNRNGTDGRVPFAQVPRLATFDGVGVYTGNYSGEDVDVRKLADVLADVGLFEPTEGGWLIHDYEQYQLTKDRLEEMTAAKRRAGQAGGRASAEARASASGRAEFKPGPGPDPVDPQSSVLVDDLETCPQVPDDVWTTYAQRKRPGDVRNIAAYDRKTIRNAKLEHGETAARWMRDFDLSTSELVAGLLEGKASRHWTRRPSPDPVEAL